MENLLITESLEIITRKVTIRESFQTSDLKVLEMGTSILVPSWQDNGIIAEFRTITARTRRVPCQWKKIREITATWATASKGTEAALIDEDNQVYLSILDHVPAAPNYPANYWWMETHDPRVQVARQGKTSRNEDGQFPELLNGEVLPAASTDLQLNYAFYQLGEMI